MKRRPKTASDLMAELQADPEWVRRNIQREDQQKINAEQRLMEIEAEEAPILAELAEAGVKIRSNLAQRLGLKPDPTPVHSISDLVNTRDSYPAAIPILAKHLKSVHHPVLIGNIARALTVKEARTMGAGRVILERLRQTAPCPTQSGDDYQARWALANALTVASDKTMVEEIKTLSADGEYADVRERLEAALKSFGQ